MKQVAFLLNESVELVGNFPVLGFYKLHYSRETYDGSTPKSIGTFGLATGVSSGKIKIVGDNAFFAAAHNDPTNIGKEKNVTDGSNQWICSTGPFDLLVEKSKFKKFIKADGQGYTKELDKSNLGSSFTLEELSLMGSPTDKTTGDISALSKMTTLKVLKLSSTSVVGDIASLSGLVNLTEISCGVNNVGGTLEEFCQGMCDNGRTSGTMSVNFISSQITYNGSVPSTTLTVTFSGGSYSVA